MKNVKKLHVALALATAILVWLAGTCGSFLIASQFGRERTQELGTAGDVFGASSALFGALSFLGLLAVLFIEINNRHRDLSDREEELRPLLVPEVDQLGVHVLKAAHTGDSSK